MKRTVYWLAWQGTKSSTLLPCERNGICLYEGDEECAKEAVLGFSEEELVSAITKPIAELVVTGDPNWSIQSFEFDTEEM